MSLLYQYSCTTLAQQIVVELKNILLLLVVFGENCPIDSGELSNEVFSRMVMSLCMEQGYIGVTFLKLTDARSISCSGALQG